MPAADRLFGASLYPLAKIDPQAPLDELNFLAQLIGDEPRVIAIGESIHGAHEFYSLRQQLVRFLIERMNFTALAWESGFPEGFLIDDYIHGRRNDRKRILLEGMTMHMGRCQEMADLVDWLREHNQNNPRVSFYGLDLPGSSAALLPALDIIAPYVESVDPGFQSRLKRLMELAASFGPRRPSSETEKLTLVGTVVIHQYVAISAADRNELTALLADLSVRFDSLRRSYVERSDIERYEFARQHLRVAVQLDLQLRAVAAFMGGDAAACEANIRDLTMADTVEWILSRHERIIILAHNGHIQRTPISTMPGIAPVDTLGVHLAHRFGRSYLVIGTTCGGGDLIFPRTTNKDGAYETELVIGNLPPAPDDSIDSFMNSNLSEPALVDLRTLSPESASRIDAARRMRVQNQFVDIDVRQSFDMLIHIPKISLWHSATNASLPDERERTGS